MKTHQALRLMVGEVKDELRRYLKKVIFFCMHFFYF